MFEIIDQSPQDAVIKVIGVGGCGGNAVEHMIGKGVAGVEFIAANTDAQALKRSTARTQLQLGSNLTRGLGAGARPEIGRDAAMEDRDRIVESISGADMLFITAGMGGGTGTGAAPVVAQVAKENGILTVAVVTRPFRFEGKRQKVAQAGIDELAKIVDSLIVIPNDKLMQVLGEEVSVLDAYAAANEVLYSAVAGIAEVINYPGLVNVDFADVRTVMSEIGMAMMGSATAAGADRRTAGRRERRGKPAARRGQPRRRPRRAGQHHRFRRPQDEGVPRGDEYHQGVHRRGRDGDRRHGHRRGDGGPAAGHDGRHRPGQRAAKARAPRLEIVEPMLERTGTDGLSSSSRSGRLRSAGAHAGGDPPRPHTRTERGTARCGLRSVRHPGLPEEAGRLGARRPRQGPVLK